MSLQQTLDGIFRVTGGLAAQSARCLDVGHAARVLNLLPPSAPPPLQRSNNSFSGKPLVPTSLATKPPSAGGNPHTPVKPLSDDGGHLPDISASHVTPPGPGPQRSSKSTTSGQRGHIPKPAPLTHGGETTPPAGDAAPVASSAAPSSRSRITASPSRIPRPQLSPAHSAISADGGQWSSRNASRSSPGPPAISPGRDRDPREAGWSLYGGGPGGAGSKGREVTVSGPSEEERKRRIEWMREKRRREEAKLKAEAERCQVDGRRGRRGRRWAAGLPGIPRPWRNPVHVTITAAGRRGPLGRRAPWWRVHAGPRRRHDS
jgi:hypothetical protein